MAVLRTIIVRIQIYFTQTSALFHTRDKVRNAILFLVIGG